MGRNCEIGLNLPVSNEFGIKLNPCVCRSGLTLNLKFIFSCLKIWIKTQTKRIVFKFYPEFEFVSLKSFRYHCTFDLLESTNYRFITLTIQINVSLGYRSRGTCLICSTGGRPSPESSTITVSGQWIHWIFHYTAW